MLIRDMEDIFKKPNQTSIVKNTVSQIKKKKTLNDMKKIRWNRIKYQ